MIESFKNHVFNANECTDKFFKVLFETARLYVHKSVCDMRCKFIPPEKSLFKPQT